MSSWLIARFGRGPAWTGVLRLPVMNIVRSHGREAISVLLHSGLPKAYVTKS